MPQYQLLRPLLEREQMASGELSSAAGLTPATATHMLDQLVRSGMITRERSAEDRRVVNTTAHAGRAPAPPGTPRFGDGGLEGDDRRPQRRRAAQRL